MAGNAHWRVGYVTVPGSAGSQSVTGLGGKPALVVFYGTNWTTEDTVVTSSGTGLFRGMAAPKYDAPSTILNSSACVLPAGDANHMSDTYCMNMITTAGTVTGASSFDYYAKVTSFDTDGFTLDWTWVQNSGRKVVYVALMDVANVGAFFGTVNQSALSFGWKAGASLLHGRWGGGGGDSNLTAEFYGGAAYPGTSTGGWFAAGLAVHTFPSSSGQFYLFLDQNLPNIVVATAGKLVASVLGTDNVVAYPTGSGLADFRFQGSASNGGMVVAWDDEDSETGLKTPAASNGGTATVSGMPFAPGLVLGYTISDEPSGPGTTSRGAAGFSVVTPDFQWCATVDGHDRGAFQSFQRGFCDAVHNTDLHAGTVQLKSDGFVMTTVEDDISPVSTLWHAFGHPTSPRRKQQIYRRVIAG